MPARILLADADRRLIEIYREHLEGLGLAVRTAADGVQCVNLLREFRPNLLLLGTSLPWGGCEGVLEVITEEPDLRPEFVLVLAARADRNVLYRVAPCRIDDFHFKPLSPCVWSSTSGTWRRNVRIWRAQGASGRSQAVEIAARWKETVLRVVKFFPARGSKRRISPGDIQCGPSRRHIFSTADGCRERSQRPTPPRQQPTR